MRPVEEEEQVAQLLGEVVGAEQRGRAAQRRRGDRIGARRPADAEIDAAGMQCFQHPELLRDDEGRVVGKHDATRTDADLLGRGREVRDEHGRRRARDAGHVVVLGDPHTVVTEAFGELGERDRAGERGRRGRAGANGSEIEHREWGTPHRREYQSFELGTPRAPSCFPGQAQIRRPGPSTRGTP